MVTLGADEIRDLRLRATIKAFLVLIRADIFPDVEDVLSGYVWQCNQWF